MKTISEYNEIIDSHREVYRPEGTANKFVVITVDTLHSPTLTPRNVSYHSISKYINDYFTAKDIETLVVPPLLGRGASGGGFSLMYFLTTHLSLILAFVRSIPVVIGAIRKIRKYNERRRNIEHQKMFRKYRTSVMLYLQVVAKSDEPHNNSNNNRDSLLSLLGMMPDLSRYLSEKYGYISFHFYLSAGIEGSSGTYSIDLTDIIPTQENIGEVFKHMDRRYVADQDDLVFTFVQAKAKLKVKSISSSSSSLRPI